MYQNFKSLVKIGYWNSQIFNIEIFIIKPVCLNSTQPRLITQYWILMLKWSNIYIGYFYPTRLSLSDIQIDACLLYKIRISNISKIQNNKVLSDLTIKFSFIEILKFLSDSTDFISNINFAFNFILILSLKRLLNHFSYRTDPSIKKTTG